MLKNISSENEWAKETIFISFSSSILMLSQIVLLFGLYLCVYVANPLLIWHADRISYQHADASVGVWRWKKLEPKSIEEFLY